MNSGKRILSAALSLSLIATVCLTAGRAQSSPRDSSALRIYFVDVEGGQATLFVTPAGQSLLIDTGWPGYQDRDALRIASAAKEAGISRIDYVLLTHYHADHTGGVPQLVAHIPVGTFIDHGPNRELDHGITEKDYADYQKVLASGSSKHIVAHPGDTLPIKGMTIKVISGDGEVINAPLPGAGQANNFCAASEIRPTDETENARSLGTEITFGSLKILDLGDLTWDKERLLMCPQNKLGSVDILVVSHHGWNQSSSPALVHAIHPRVAIMDNGAKKGGSTPVMKTVLHSPGLETLWQLHYSEEGGPENNTPEKYIANVSGPDTGFPIELTAHTDGTFEVVNKRSGYKQDYAAKH